MAGEGLAFAGVSLEQYAGVTAAVVEEIPLADVLAQEQIEPASWASAEPKWAQTLAESPDLMLVYAQKRRVAEDALGRSISPLDDDPGSWAAMLAALSVADDLAAVLKPMGLRATDVGRLGRAWNKKAAADPEVTRALSEAAAKPAPAPKVKVEPTKLKPFPWSPKRAAASAGDAARAAASTGAEGDDLLTPIEGSLPVEVDVDLYAALAVALHLLPAERAAILPLCGLDEPMFAALAARWRAKLQADPDLNAELSVKTTDHREALRRMLAGAPAQIAGR